MNKNSIKRLLSVLMVLVSVAAMTLLTSCSGNSATHSSSGVQESSYTAEAAEHSFTFVAQLADGSTKSYDIKTTKTTVGAALIDEGLISGDDGEFGLYVKTVCGEYHDYDTDGMYWAFYIGDEFASTGVDVTKIVDGTTYKLAVGK